MWSVECGWSVERECEVWASIEGGVKCLGYEVACGVEWEVLVCSVGWLSEVEC